eukprot:scaffold929_cov387-Prasinococcus_capsulatus_cf.AAC.12
MTHAAVRCGGRSAAHGRAERGTARARRQARLRTLCGARGLGHVRSATGRHVAACVLKHAPVAINCSRKLPDTMTQATGMLAGIRHRHRI